MAVDVNNAWQGWTGQGGSPRGGRARRRRRRPGRVPSHGRHRMRWLSWVLGPSARTLPLLIAATCLFFSPLFRLSLRALSPVGPSTRHGQARVDGGHVWTSGTWPSGTNHHPWHRTRRRGGPAPRPLPPPGRDRHVGPRRESGGGGGGSYERPSAATCRLWFPPPPPQNL